MNKSIKPKSTDFSNSGSCIFSYDYKDGEIVQLNFLSGEVEALFGIPKEQYVDMLVKNQVWKNLLVGSSAETKTEQEEIINRGKPGDFRYRILRDGEERWLEEKIFPSQIEDGVFVISGLIHDITEKLFSENEIANSEKKFRRLFENNLAGVYVTHRNGKILDCNRSFASILGYNSVEEVKETTIDDHYYHPGDREDYLAHLQKEGSIPNHIAILKRKDGRRLIVDNNVSIAADENGELNIIEGTLIDVTVQTEAADDLRIGEEKYRMLFEEASNAILLISLSDQGNYIIDCNEKAEQTFNCQASDLIGVIFEEVVCPKKRESGCEVLFEEDHVQLEWKFIRKTGEVFDVDIWTSQITIGDETICQMIISDVSSRKKKEIELRESRQSFQNIVDNSLAAMFIFTNEKLVYANPIGESLHRTHLNSQMNELFNIFPKKYQQMFNQLLDEAENGIHSYTEIALGTKETEKYFSINIVKTTHNNQKSQLVMLRDISLQNEHNFQKHRAELAEFANEKLQEEIARHKQTQKELLDKTSRLKAFHESAHNLYAATIDRDYKLTSFNTNFQNEIVALFGKKVELGSSLVDYFLTDKNGEDALTKKFEEALSGVPSELISHFPTGRGEYWIESFFYPILKGDNEVEEISIISRNITEKIEIQQQVLKSEESHRATLLAIPDFIFRINSSGVFTDSGIKNKALGELEQFVSSPDFIGKSIDEIFLNRKMAQEFLDNLKIALSGEGLHTQHFSFFMGNPDEGNKRFFENRFSKINNDEVVVISRDITESMEYESRLIKSVREKEVLLKEVHHRVKNNLQVINSILNLQSSYINDPETLEIINESQNRIRSMSYIHESLYQTKDFNSIDFCDYVTNLVQNLVHSYQLTNDKVKLDLKVDKVDLALDQAIPCGLILNELISNSLKYAYSADEGKGLIRIKIKEKDSEVRMITEDFGKGLPEDFDIAETDTLGLSLVHSLVDQLDGELVLETGKGTKFLIIFTKQDF